MNVVFLTLWAALGSLLLYLVYASERYRAKAIRAFASRSGFHYIGMALPKSLALEGTPFSRVAKVWNVIDGDPRGVRIIVFDCQVGVGKASRRRTVIAVENDAGCQPPLGADMTVARAGNWNIFYRAKGGVGFRITGLTPFVELEPLVRAVVTCTAKSGE